MLTKANHAQFAEFDLVVILLLFILLLPAWPYSAGWGYFPSGGLGLVLLILLLLIVLKKF